MERSSLEDEAIPQIADQNPKVVFQAA